jgi:Ca-activated chloride channel family protein
MRRSLVIKGLLPYVLLAIIAGPIALYFLDYLDEIRQREIIKWRNPWALALLAGCPLLAWVQFHLRVKRAPTMAYSRVGELSMTRPGIVWYLSSLPGVLRITAVALIAVALARPQTYKEETVEVEGIDIMIVLDLSKSMEERDLRRNRLDAGQRTIRNFLCNRQNDRIGLVVFAQKAMTQHPLTLDYNSLDQIVANLAIGDVPEMGTAIGDALALSLGSLRRSGDKDKVVILLSDGDSNWTTKFDPIESKNLAKKMGVKVFTILLGRAGGAAGPFGSNRYAVNPELLREIAKETGGKYFRAGDDQQLEDSFNKVRETLDKSRHKEIRRVPNQELFGKFVIFAVILLFLEILLRLTRFRRFP